MGGDIIHRRSYYLSGCMSPSCVPVHEEYARIPISGHDKSQHRNRRLRKLLRKIVNESKSIYGPAKPITFQYDAVSYSQNFDEGCHKEDQYLSCQQIVRWRQHVVHDKWSFSFYLFFFALFCCVKYYARYMKYVFITWMFIFFHTHGHTHATHRTMNLCGLNWIVGHLKAKVCKECIYIYFSTRLFLCVSCKFFCYPDIF